MTKRPSGETNNLRLELAFLERTYRWLKPGGVLVFVIPQLQVRVCARPSSEHFTDLFVHKLTGPASVQYNQIAVLGVHAAFPCSKRAYSHMQEADVLFHHALAATRAGTLFTTQTAQASGFPFSLQPRIRGRWCERACIRRFCQAANP